MNRPALFFVDEDLKIFAVFYLGSDKRFPARKGAVVAIEPSTGEILCLISSPTYDPNSLVSGKERNKSFARMYADTINVPLFNRALTAMYPPGSIFKLIDALIAQNDGLINRNTSYPG